MKIGKDELSGKDFLTRISLPCRKTPCSHEKLAPLHRCPCGNAALLKYSIACPRADQTMQAPASGAVFSAKTPMARQFSGASIDAISG